MDAKEIPCHPTERLNSQAMKNRIVSLEEWRLAIDRKLLLLNRKQNMLLLLTALGIVLKLIIR